VYKASQYLARVEKQPIGYLELVACALLLVVDTKGCGWMRNRGQDRKTEHKEDKEEEEEEKEKKKG